MLRPGTPTSCSGYCGAGAPPRRPPAAIGVLHVWELSGPAEGWAVATGGPLSGAARVCGVVGGRRQRMDPRCIDSARTHRVPCILPVPGRGAPEGAPGFYSALFLPRGDPRGPPAGPPFERGGKAADGTSPSIIQVFSRSNRAARGGVLGGEPGPGRRDCEPAPLPADGPGRRPRRVRRRNSPGALASVGRD